MKPEPGVLVCAVFPFRSTENGELNLVVGSVVQVVRKVDRHWSFGWCDGVCGQFPSSCVTDVPLPDFSTGQQLFVARDGFAAQESEDLAFQKGDVIVGIEAIDQNWWRGTCDGRSGIFPLNLVWKLNMSQLQIENPIKGKRAVVNTDLKAQLDEEMDLRKGDVVTITEVIDKNWYRGECNGTSGIFPSAFVKILETDTASADQGEVQPPSNGHQAVQADVAFETSNPPEKFMAGNASNRGGGAGGHSIISGPHAKALYPFRGEFSNELSFEAGAVIRLIRRVDSQWYEGETSSEGGDRRVGLLPLCYVHVVVDLPPSDIDVPKEELGTAGVGLYDFQPQMDGDVGVREGERVTVVDRVNDDWYRVRNAFGETGLCPATYVQLVEAATAAATSSGAFRRQMSLPAASVSAGGHRPNSPSIPKWPNSSKHEDGATKLVDDVMAKNLSELQFVNANTMSFPASLKGHMARNGHVASARPFSLPVATGVAHVKPTPDSEKVCSTLMASHVQQQRRSSCPSTSPQMVPKSRPPRPPALPSTSVTAARNFPTPLPRSDRSAPVPQRPAPPVPGHPKNFNHHRHHQRPASVATSAVATPSTAKSQHLRRRATAQTRRTMSDAGSRSSAISSSLSSSSSSLVNAGSDRMSESDDGTFGVQFRGKSTTMPALRRAESVVASQMDMKERNREKRRRIFDELLQTEKDYIADLRFCRAAFLDCRDEAKAKGMDVEVLFGHLVAVLHVSQKLLSSLEGCASQSSSCIQSVGKSFQELATDIKNAYGDYCSNYDDASSLLEKYKSNPQLMAYIQFKLESDQNRLHFDLSSLLIKPMQRVLKYPLLLTELVKAADDGEAEKSELTTALTTMTAVASEINEYKRRRDLVLKYRKETDTGLSSKISKLNLHSVMKKSQRIGMRLSSHLGLVSVTKDIVFDELDQKFHDVERTVKQLLKNVEAFCADLLENVNVRFKLSECMAEFYANKMNTKEIDRFRTVQREILTNVWPQFKKAVDTRVNDPLAFLLHLYEGPIKLIEKRNDKLLDLDSASQRVERNNDANRSKILRDELQMARNNYNALNSQLLEDLPKLVQLSITILVECVSAFIHARRAFIGRTTKLLYEIAEEIPDFAPASEDILVYFNKRHNEVMDWMTSNGLVPKDFQPSPRPERASKEKEIRVTTDGSSKANPQLASANDQMPTAQSSSQKAYLQGRYPPQQLFCAMQAYYPSDALEVPLNPGDWVAVIKDRDPMGGTERYFVDNGSVKGLVPSHLLTPSFQCASQPPPTGQLAPPSSLQKLTSNPSSPRQDRKHLEKEVEVTRQPLPHYYDFVAKEPEIWALYDNVPSMQDFETSEVTNGSDRYDLPYEDASLSAAPSLLEELDPLQQPSLTTVKEEPQETHSDLETDGTPVDEYYYAGYEFRARGPHELSLARSQVVLVRHKHDLEGNPEWWFVQDRYANQGYVPANYLSCYQGE